MKGSSSVSLLVILHHFFQHAFGQEPTPTRRPGLELTTCGRSRPVSARMGTGSLDDPFQLTIAKPSRNKREGIHPLQTIVGGSALGLGDACWQAKIHRDGFFVCGGSIIGRRTILTASHCIHNYKTGLANSPTRFMVVVGALESGTTMITGDPQVCAQQFNVVSATVHPRFNSKSNEHDIAIMTLDDDIDFRYPCVCPVCLTSQIPNEGQMCTVTGYGLDAEGAPPSADRKLTFVNIEILATRFGGECFIQRDKESPDLNNILCAGREKNKDACQGDSGGPLVCFDAATRRHYQSGVVSYGVGCGRGIPGVYTRITSYLSWIQETSKEKNLLAFQS